MSFSFNLNNNNNFSRRNFSTHSSLRQQTLRPSIHMNRDSDASWGHELAPKSQGILRLGFRNINSLPIQRLDPKNNQIILDVKSFQFDCMGVAEVNLAWQNLPYVDQLEERFRGMFEFAKYTSANNRDPSFRERQQSGGTMMVVNGFMCARVFHSDRDPRKLGRWCSNLLRGKNGLKLRIITIYRPVVSKGALSAYQQQRCILYDNDIDTCPRIQLLQDLET